MMFLRFFNVQGIAGTAASLALAILLVIQKGETRHWRKESGRNEQLYRGEEAAFAGTVANYRAAAEGPAPTTRRMPNASRPSSRHQARRLPMSLKHALPLLALLLSACATVPKPQPIPAVAEARQCPAYPLPPADLIKAPAKTDFLPKTVSPPPSNPSSSTN